MSKTIHFEETEYQTLETLAKKFDFKNVDELVSTALISFFSETFNWGIEPEDAKKFLAAMQKEQAKNPDFSFLELLKKWKTMNSPNIETVEVTVKVPCKLLRMVKDSEGENWLTYLSDSLTDSLAADIHAETFGKMDHIIEKYDLAEEFKSYQGH